MHKLLAAAIGLLCLGVTEARAQPTARDSLVLRALSRFEKGDRIRVALLRSPFVGTYVGTRGDTVFFRDAGAAADGVPIQCGGLGVARRARNGAWRLVGCSRSAVSGLAYWAVAAGDGARDPKSRLGARGVGAVAGAIMGSAIGMLFKRWRLVYGNPAPQGFDLTTP